MFRTKFQVNWPFGSGEEAKNNSKDGSYLGFPIGTVQLFFDLQVTLMLPTKLQVNWNFGSEEEAKNKFSK